MERYPIFMLVSGLDSEYEMRKSVLAARKSSFPKSFLDRKRISNDGLGRGISGRQNSESYREVAEEGELFCHWYLLNHCSW